MILRKAFKFQKQFLYVHLILTLIPFIIFCVSNCLHWFAQFNYKFHGSLGKTYLSDFDVSFWFGFSFSFILFIQGINFLCRIKKQRDEGKDCFIDISKN